MNVKAGDLAYIVDSGPYTGRVVEVSDFEGQCLFDPAMGVLWWVNATWPALCEAGMLARFLYPDSLLRPITGVPMEDDTPVETNVPEAVRLAWGIEAPVLS